MKTLLQLIAMIGVGLSLSAGAQSLDQTIVYIQCKSGDGGKETVGSGVLISGNGMVLTAKHVIPDEPGSECFGAIGNAFDPKSKLIFRRKSANFDAALLQFSGKTGLPHVKYCKLTNELRRATVFATGFPGRTETGVPSSRVGVLSTVQPGGAAGLIETDSATTRGMSGGMVTLGNSTHLIGIIAGAKFDPGTGQPDFWGVLPAQELASEFGQSGLEALDGPCAVGMADPIEWKSGDEAVQLGVYEGRGFCFLTKVWGVFNDKYDQVYISVGTDGQYVLSGARAGGGEHGATAQCVRL